MKIFVTATGTNVGKTYVTRSLIHHFHRLGITACGYKPIETGVQTTPLDGQALLDASHINPTLRKLTLNDITTYTFPLAASPAVADPKHTIEIEKIVDHAHWLEKKCDILIIEGAGGVMTPLNTKETMIDLPLALNATPLLVAGGYLGSISDTLLALHAFEVLNTSPVVCFNPQPHEEDFYTISLPYWNSKFKRVMIYDTHISQIAHILQERGEIR